MNLINIFSLFVALVMMTFQFFLKVFCSCVGLFSLWPYSVVSERFSI